MFTMKQLTKQEKKGWLDVTLFTGIAFLIFSLILPQVATPSQPRTWVIIFASIWGGLFVAFTSCIARLIIDYRMWNKYIHMRKDEQELSSFEASQELEQT